jgi:subtilisin family serine protease
VVSDELNGKIPDSAILAGLKYISLFKRGGKPLVRVINMSFGKYTRSRSVSLMIRLLREEGTIMIAAAGNEDSMKRSYPAGYGDSLAVSALDRNLRRAPYSNFGPWVDLAAPGGAQQDVISSYPGGLWFGQNGTSQAAPIVSGVAALYVAVNPEASYDDIKTALLSSSNGAIYNIEVADGYNRYYLQKVEGESVLRPLLGAGIVDAEAALKGYVQGYTAAKNTQRVGYGCGVVGRRLSSSVPNGMAEFPMWLCVLLLPVLFLAVGGRGQGDASTARNSRRVASKGCGSI